jgi:hypothetical protein
MTPDFYLIKQADQGCGRFEGRSVDLERVDREQ